MLVITPDIPKDPYDEKHFKEMVYKFGTVCDRELNIKYLSILKETIEEITTSQNNGLFNKNTQKLLHRRFSQELKQSPCFEIFYRSIIIELFRNFINQPVSHIYTYIDKLTLISKNNVI